MIQWNVYLINDFIYFYICFYFFFGKVILCHIVVIMEISDQSTVCHYRLFCYMQMHNILIQYHFDQFIIPLIFTLVWFSIEPIHIIFGLNGS